MDLATILGMALGAFFLYMGMSSDPTSFVDLPSMQIVFGGGFATVLTCSDLKRYMKIPKILGIIFSPRKINATELITQIVGFAEMARRDGILALQNVTDQIKDPFLVQGINLAVDGTDPEQILATMETEMKYLGSRHTSGKKIFDNLNTFGPAYGLLGTVIGLILMLKNLNDASTIGASMAIALVTTFYGSLLANFFFGPFAEKLAVRHEEEVLIKQIIINGVMSIQSGDNPRIVRQKLAIFLEPKMRGPILAEA
ncbi:MAG: MotA/TolQ/ExbB proton channel family protein [Planctomycetes bacterium]|nr:MotA/TolQ/ExbB proton channel family protein [Planctomycetota bacterium]